MANIKVEVSGVGIDKHAVAAVTIKEELEQSLHKTIITSPAALRAVLLQSIEKVMCGKMSVPQANAVASLSAEVHKSVRQEYDMTMYALQQLGMRDGTNILELDAEDENSKRDDNDAEGNV